MKKNTSLRLLGSLNHSEQKEFRRFLSSPYFNQRKDVVQLFEYYLDGATFFKSPIDKAELYRQMYPDSKYDDAKLRHLLSYLTALLKKFLGQKGFEADHIYQRIQLAKKLKQKSLLQEFEKTWNTTFSLNQKQKRRNAQYHYSQYLLYLLQSEFQDQQKRKGEQQMQLALDELKKFYTASVLKHNCSIITTIKMHNQAFNFDKIIRTLELVRQSDLNKTPAIAIYYYSILMLQSPEEDLNYEQFESLIHKSKDHFSTIEIRDHYLMAINYCIKKLNSGQDKYIRAAFEWYREGLKDGVLLENGVLSLFAFKNILNLGIALKEYDWIEKYLDEYKVFLQPKDRENRYQYCRAVLLFNIKKYEEVLNLIQKVEFEHPLHQLDARRMLLRIYYEFNEISSLQSLLDSFTVYIRRKKSIGYHKSHYLNLIQFMRKILKANLNQKRERQELIGMIKNTAALAERNWLLSLLTNKK